MADGDRERQQQTIAHQKARLTALNESTHRLTKAITRADRWAIINGIVGVYVLFLGVGFQSPLLVVVAFGSAVAHIRIDKHIKRLRREEARHHRAYSILSAQIAQLTEQDAPGSSALPFDLRNLYLDSFEKDVFAHYPEIIDETGASAEISIDLYQENAEDPQTLKKDGASPETLKETNIPASPLSALLDNARELRDAGEMSEAEYEALMRLVLYKNE